MRTQRETDLEDEIELLSGQLLAFYARVDALEKVLDAAKGVTGFEGRGGWIDYVPGLHELRIAIANIEVAVAVRVGPNSTGITDDMIIERGRE